MTKALFFACERVAMLRLCEKYFQFQEIEVYDYPLMCQDMF